MKPTPVNVLKAFAAFAPDPPAGTRQQRSGFDVDQWIAKYGVPVRRGPEPWPGGGAGTRRWHLAECINGHDDQAAFIVQFSNGALAAGCHHNSCKGLDWQEFREHYEPGYDREKGPDRRNPSAVQEDKPPRLTITTLSNVQPEKVKWLWPRRILMGKLTLLAGDPGLGKSYLMLDAAARISVGGMWPDGGDVPEGDVLIVTAEDALNDAVRPRLDLLEADVRRIHSIGISVREGDHEVGLSLTDHLMQIEAAIAEYRAVLLVLDPLLALMGRRTDTYKASEVRPILAQLAAVAERTGCAIVAIMHLNKRSGENNALYRLTASLDFGAAARSVLVVGKNPNDPQRRVFVSAKSNLSAPPEALGFHFMSDGIFAWEQGTLDIDAQTLLSSSILDSEKKDAVQEAEDFLMQVLGEDGQRTDLILNEAKQAGISPTTIRRAKLNIDVRAIRVSEGNQGRGYWKWQPPERSQGDHPPGIQGSDHLAKVQPVQAEIQASPQDDHNDRFVETHGNVANVPSPCGGETAATLKTRKMMERSRL